MILRWWRRQRELAHACTDLARMLAAACQERDDARREADALQELGARAARERDAALEELRKVRARVDALQRTLSRWPVVN